MKLMIWLIGAAAIGALVYGVVKWRKRSEELRRASEERSAALMAEVMATTKSRPASPLPGPPPPDAELAKAEFAKAAEAARAAEAGRAADLSKAADLAKQRLLFDAAFKAGEAGEPVLSIQLYARLLARYPDSAFASQARAAVEAQKRHLTKA